APAGSESGSRRRMAVAVKLHVLRSRLFCTAGGKAIDAGAGHRSDEPAVVLRITRQEAIQHFGMPGKSVHRRMILTVARIGVFRISPFEFESSASGNSDRE